VQANKSEFLDHVKWLRQAVMTAGAEFILAGDSLHALIRRGPQHWALHPQFLMFTNGIGQYTAQLHEQSETFAGWLPYRNKRWPISSDKLAFKRFAGAAGLPVPEYFAVPDESLRDVIVKRAASSFGRHLHGPFRSARERPLDLSQSEYYERFIQGDILKIWFWNETLVCAEQIKMPFVIGDGASTVRELITYRAEHRTRFTKREFDELLANCSAVLQYLGADLETIVPKGTRQLVEFRYSSRLRPPRGRVTLDLTAMPEAPWMAIVRRAGRELVAGIPAGIRANTLFTVDAILDEAGQIWLLEMNSNPMTHPLAYPHIIQSILASEVSVAPPVQQSPPA
jgi:hypothetical protein